LLCFAIDSASKNKVLLNSSKIYPPLLLSQFSII